MELAVILGLVLVIMIGGMLWLTRRSAAPALPPKTIVVPYDIAKLDRDIRRFELALEQMAPHKHTLRAEREAHLRYLKAMRDAQGTN